jgi:hypothetical protein
MSMQSAKAAAPWMLVRCGLQMLCSVNERERGHSQVAARADCTDRRESSPSSWHWIGSSTPDVAGLVEEDKVHTHKHA